MNARSFDSIAPFYDASRGGEERGRRFAEAIGGVLDAGRPVVEVGVGTGVVALGLMQRGFTVAGIDVSEPMLRVAAGRIGGRVARGDATGLPLADASIDQMYSVWLLHLVPAAAVLREAARVLRRDGRYAVVSSVKDTAAPGDDAGAVLDDLMRSLDPDWTAGRLDGIEAVTALVPDAGLAVASAGVIGNPFTQTPLELIGRIEARAYSRLVNLDEDRRRDVVEPALARLRALPDQSRPRHGMSRHDLMVLRPA